MSRKLIANSFNPCIKQNDLKKYYETSCLYMSIIFSSDLREHKRYKFENFFELLGQLPDTKGKSQFALLDNFAPYPPILPKIPDNRRKRLPKAVT